jgi:hypothetical protein
MYFNQSSFHSVTKRVGALPCSVGVVCVERMYEHRV